MTAPNNTPSDVSTPNTSRSDNESFSQEIGELFNDFSPSMIIDTLEDGSSDAKGEQCIIVILVT